MVTTNKHMSIWDPSEFVLYMEFTWQLKGRMKGWHKMNSVTDHIDVKKYEITFSTAFQTFRE